MSDKDYTHDPETYKKMRVPFPSKEEANKALDDFRDKVYQARIDCRIAEVMVVGISYTDAHIHPAFFIFGSTDAVPVLGDVAVRQLVRIRSEQLRREAEALEAMYQDKEDSGG